MPSYTEYNDDRVKQLIELSKKEYPYISEYMMFLMSVDLGRVTSTQSVSVVFDICAKTQISFILSLILFCQK